MWCLETVIALNEAACKRAKKDEPEYLAHKDVRISTTFFLERSRESQKT